VTSVDETPGTAEASGGDATPAADGSTDQGRRWYVAELLLMIELGGLAAFAFGRPVLDTFGRSPDTFVARGADAFTIVLFGLVVALGPYVAVGLLGMLGRPFGPTVRRRAHVVLVAVVGGLAVWQLGQGITGYPPESQKLAVAGVIGGLALGYLRASVGPMASFLRFVGVASVIFLVQFLFMSPTSGLVTGDVPALDDAVVRQVAADLGDDPPDVVVLLFDALPTVSLLDGTGRVDAELFPNFARLAATSSWYRNNTTVASFTDQAVPAILTGRFRPEGTDNGRLGADDDENLFTLLGGSYEMHVEEQITRLCPGEVCTDAPSGGLTTLLGDAVDSWVGGTSGGDDSGELDLPGALEPSRYADAGEWEASQAPRDPDRPQLRFHHVVLPHTPWVVTDDGDLYRGVASRPTGAFGLGWTDTGVALGNQRHILQLQAADRLLGDVLDGLEDEGRFDDAMIVVTADHGNAFISGEPERALAEGNMEQIMWTPLLIKEPAQTTSVVDDSNVMSIDIVPTIADALGVEMPWEVDGIPVSEVAAERDDDTKLFQSNENNRLRAPDGEPVLEIDDTRERFARVVASDMVEGRGPDGAWRRTAHGGLFGLEVEALDVGEAAEGAISVERLSDIEGSDREEPLAEVVGHVPLPQGTVVAYALNGTIAAVTEVEPPLGDDRGAALGLVPARLFRDGGNELTAYVVEGPVGTETLRPIDVAEDD
jgi:Sulfatase